MELWYTAGKTFAMLCVVLGVLLACLYALKQFTQQGGINQCQMKLISSFSIGPKKQIVVIDIMHERYVLGVTSESINCLSKYKTNDIPEDTHAENLETSSIDKSDVQIIETSDAKTSLPSDGTSLAEKYRS